MSNFNRLEIIDYFKGLAIIMIIVCHLTQVFDIPSPLSSMSSFGRMGCQIFFLLSGFTITMSYDKSGSKLMTFYKKRWLGLAPGYWLSILITVILSAVTILITGKNQLGTSLTIEDIVLNLLLLNGLVPTEANNMVFRGGWFVGTLTMLYIIYPFLYRGERKYGNIFLYGCIFISMLISAALFLLTDKVYSSCGDFLYFCFINQLSPFVLGILLYRNLEIGKYDKLKSFVFFILSVLFFLYPVPFRAVIVPYFFSLSVFYLLKVLWDKKLPLSKMLCRFGELSYPIFLLHIFIIWDIPILILSHFVPLNFGSCLLWGIVSLVIIYYAGRPYNQLIRMLTNQIKAFVF